MAHPDWLIRRGLDPRCARWTQVFERNLDSVRFFERETTLLGTSVLYHCHYALKRLLDLGQIDPDGLDSHGCSPLMAAMTVFFECADHARENQLCIQTLSPLSNPLLTDSDGNDALMLAIKHGRTREALHLAPRSELSLRNHQGQSALLLALDCDTMPLRQAALHLELVQLLAEGSDVHALDCHQRGVAHACASHPVLEVVELFAKAPFVHARDACGFTPLMRAAMTASAHLDVFLACSDAHAVDSAGRDALMCAIEAGAIDAAESLADRSDLSLVDFCGEGALEKALPKPRNAPPSPSANSKFCAPWISTPRPSTPSAFEYPPSPLNPL